MDKTAPQRTLRQSESKPKTEAKTVEPKPSSTSHTQRARQPPSELSLARYNALKGDVH